MRRERTGNRALAHGHNYSTIRKSLNLSYTGGIAEYVPTCNAIVVDSGHQSGLLEKILNHELYHSRQLIATSAGITLKGLLCLRSTVFKNFIGFLNKRYDSGLWVPIKGWMDDVHGGDYNAPFSDNHPYPLISEMKARIGIIDSALYSLGAFESLSGEDCSYWHSRFPWGSLFPDKMWNWSFTRSTKEKGWWGCGLTSLLESSALYLELLAEIGDIHKVNRQLGEILAKQKESGKKISFDQFSMTYLWPFMLCEQYIPENTPYHLVLIAAFWSLNGPVPQMFLLDEIPIRSNDKGFAWNQVDPGILFFDMLPDVLDSLRGSETRDLAESAMAWIPVYFGKKKYFRTADFIGEDLDHVAGMIRYGGKLGLIFEKSFREIEFPSTVEDRAREFFTFPPNKSHLKKLHLISRDSISGSKEILDWYLIHTLSEHMIPTWSVGKISRFRIGKPFVCPSRTGPLESLCKEPRCNGMFPKTVGLPSKCWFQSSIAKSLNLRADRIGIVPGEYASEDEAEAADMLY